MADIFDYLEWRGDLSLEQSPFNPVDNIILTHLSYLPLDNIVPGIDDSEAISLEEAARTFAKAMKKKPGHFDKLFVCPKDPLLLTALGASRRYGGMGLTGYINQIDPEVEKQFAALTILTGDKSSFITYRGTDNTLVGWKESFNMSFSAEIPAQREAVCYLEKTARQIRGPLRIGGHSKGGNLAVYAASFCSKKIRRRISEIYSNDAPGFKAHVIHSEGYKAIRDKIISFVPETSVIGMLFEHENNYTVVKSTQTGLLQHDVYSWEVAPADVVRLKRINKESRFIDRTIKEWLAGLDYKQRQSFTEALYTILSSTETSSIPELTAGWLRNAVVMIQSLTSIDDQSRDMVFKTLSALLRAAKNNIYTLLPAQKKKQLPEKSATPARPQAVRDKA
ncbi:MAG: DUF2974 domain-containing protein [Treponema sp.]|jgi:hypothetical protein|nr:DUF2974 domain-containing protein [Treponema sp.]